MIFNAQSTVSDYKNEKKKKTSNISNNRDYYYYSLRKAYNNREEEDQEAEVQEQEEQGSTRTMKTSGIINFLSQTACNLRTKDCDSMSVTMKSYTCNCMST